MGRIFKDPIGLRAASLIEQAGLKSARVGGAELSDKHANFVVVHQGATSEDVIRLVDILRSQVRDRVGVELETDVEFW